MPAMIVILLLLVANCSYAASDQHLLKAVEPRTVSLYWLTDSEQAWPQTVFNHLAAEHDRFSWQQVSTAAELQNKLEQPNCQQRIVVWQSDTVDENLLLEWAEQSISVMVINASMPESLQKKLASFANEPAWLDSEQTSEVLQQQLRHRLWQIHQTSSYVLAPPTNQALHFSDKQAYLLQQIPSAQQRWSGDIKALPTQESAQNTLWLQADGRFLNQDDIDEALSLGQIHARSYSLAGLGEFAAISTEQWRNLFPSAHQHYSDLLSFYDMEQWQQLLSPLRDFLQGRSIFQQQFSYALADNPNNASLLLSQNSEPSLFYQGSDGALHQWRFLQGEAYQWHTVYSQKALSLSPDLLWNTEQRERFYSGQLSAAINSQQGKAWLFASSGSAERGLYAYDVSTELPQLAWHKANGDLAKLGWTFNKITPLAINYTQQEKQAVLFGAGIDSSYRHASQRPEMASQGNAAYLLAAATGELVWQLRYGESISVSNTAFSHPKMKHAVAASFSLNQKRDTAFVGDMGGQVWRISLPQCQGSECLSLQYRQQHWQADVIAQSAAIESGFFHAVALWEKPHKTYIAAINSSAWQESEQAAKLFFFAAEQAVDLDSLASLAQCEQGNCGQGWHYQLGQGEKLYADPVIWQDNLYFLTYQESPQSCHFVADSYRLYRFKLNESKAVMETKQLAENSVYLTINSQNIAALAPAIERWLAGSDAVQSLQAMLESFNHAREENGIVISSWREYFY